MKLAVHDMLQWARRAGISLAEVVVALLLLGGAMLAVTSAGTAVIGQFKGSRAENELWGALQTVGDSLQQLGYGNVTTDACPPIPDPCRVVAGGYNFFWTVSDSTIVSAANDSVGMNRIGLVGWVCEPDVNVCGPGTAIAPLRYEDVLIYLADY